MRVHMKTQSSFFSRRSKDVAMATRWGQMGESGLPHLHSLHWCSKMDSKTATPMQKDSMTMIPLHCAWAAPEFWHKGAGAEERAEGYNSNKAIVDSRLCHGACNPWWVLARGLNHGHSRYAQKAKFGHVVYKICTQTCKETDTLGWKCAVISRTVFYFNMSYEMRTSPPQSHLGTACLRHSRHSILHTRRTQGPKWPRTEMSGTVTAHSQATMSSPWQC